VGEPFTSRPPSARYTPIEEPTIRPSLMIVAVWPENTPGPPTPPVELMLSVL
jgi:hypothetical protein